MRASTASTSHHAKAQAKASSLPCNHDIIAGYGHCRVSNPLCLIKYLASTAQLCCVKAALRLPQGNCETSLLDKDFPDPHDSHYELKSKTYEMDPVMVPLLQTTPKLVPPESHTGVSHSGLLCTPKS